MRIIIKLPFSLLVTIIYFICYGLVTEWYVINHWNEWAEKVYGTSPAYTLGYFMKGPILGILFLIAAYMLSIKQIQGQKLAVVCLLFAVLSDTNSFAWSFADGKPSNQILLISGAIVLSWNAIWFYLLKKKSTSEVLG